VTLISNTSRVVYLQKFDNKTLMVMGPPYVRILYNVIRRIEHVTELKDKRINKAKMSCSLGT
jgi:hypothetical protein